MLQFFSKFIAIGIVYLIAFFLVSFLLNIAALRVGGKSAKPESGTWLNAFKAAVIIFLTSALFSVLGSYLQSLNLSIQPGTMNGLMGVLVFLSLVIDVTTIKKIFDLAVGETVKAVIITVIVDGLLHMVLIGVFVVLFFGTFFSQVAPSNPIPSSVSDFKVPIVMESTSQRKLPKLPSKIAPATVAEPAKLPIPVSISAPDPESLKRDEARIGRANEIIMTAKTASPEKVSEMLVGATLMPCAPIDKYPYGPKAFALERDSCETMLIKELSDGFAIIVGMENASNSNLDTRKAPLLSNDSSIQVLQSILGSVSADTPSKNLVFVALFQQPRKVESAQRARSVGSVVDLTNLYMSMELYYSEKGEFPDAPADHCITPDSATYKAIEPYWRSKIVGPFPPASTLTLTCESAFYYKTFEINGKKNSSYVLAVDVGPKEANFELSPLLDDSLFTSPEAILAKIEKGGLTQEPDNPLRSIYVIIP